jgi:hypothetical protein
MQQPHYRLESVLFCAHLKVSVGFEPRPIPLAIQREEHLEMWMLLGDPAMKLPDPPAEIRLEAPTEIAEATTILIRGTLPSGFVGTQVRVTLARPMSGQPLDMQPIPDAPPEARSRVILANHDKANAMVLLTKDTTARDRRFDLQLDLPRKLTWPRLILRAQAVYGDADALGAISVPVKPPQPAH